MKIMGVEVTDASVAYLEQLNVFLPSRCRVKGMGQPSTTTKGVALTVLFVPCSLDSVLECASHVWGYKAV
jgi:hypothetical protein